MDAGTVAIGGIVLLPTIVGLIQLAKRFFPQAPGNLWLACAFFLGVLGQFIIYVIANGGTFTALAEWTLALWAACIVTGLTYGLAAAKAYDEAAAAHNVVGRAVRGLGNE